MLSSHASKLRPSSRGSTVTTTTTITNTTTTTTAAAITRKLSIPDALPNRVLLVRQFTIGPDSNLTKPLVWPEHVVKVINQLKQVGPAKPNTTKSVDPVTTNPKMKPAVHNTTTATSFPQTTP